MKKKIVEVDEDVLKEIIVGDIPVFGKDSPAPKEKSASGSEKSCRNRTGRCSSGKARRGEAQKEKG